LNDYNYAKALLHLLLIDLYLRFSFEFNIKRMLHVTQNPLNHAHKIFIIIGIIDGDGNMINDANVGYHYA
jgi:hypothetical protein